MSLLLYLSKSSVSVASLHQTIEKRWAKITGREQTVTCWRSGAAVLFTAGVDIEVGQSADTVSTCLGWMADGAEQWQAPDWPIECPAGRFALLRFAADGSGEAATDRLGLEPLWWSRQDDAIAVGNRADLLPLLLGRTTQLNPQAIYDYLYFHCVPTPLSIFAQVQRLPAAQRLRWGAGAPAQSPWWQPEFSPRRFVFAEQKEKLFQGLRGAVRRASGNATGSFLSGGIDSSSVTAVLQEQRPGSPAFSMGFADAEYDELAFAKTAAEAFNAPHRTLTVTADDVLDNLRAIARFTPEPFGNSSALPTLVCARFAKQQGISRLLAGDGGDELFGGNQRYAKQLLFDVYDRLPAPLRAGLRALARRLGNMPSWPTRKFARYIEQAVQPMPARMESYNQLGEWGAAAVLSPGLLAQVDTGHPAQLQAQVYAAAHADHIVDRMLVLDWQFTLTDNDLRKVSWMADLADIRVEYPYLDSQLLGLSQELPARQKVRPRALRVFVRRAMRGFLPNAILDKRKQGFGLPVGPWLLEDERLRAMAVEALEALVQRGVVQSGFVHDLMQVKLPAHPAYYGPMVWVLMMLELWCEEHELSFSFS